MDHRQYIEHYLSADVDDELTAPERQAVMAHLANCPDCRQRQSAERALKSLLHDRIPIVAAPAELRDRIIAALDRETARPAAKPARITRRRLWFGSVAALAAAAVVAVIVIRGMSPSHPPDPALEAAARDYLQSEQSFRSAAGLSSVDNLAMALATEFGFPYVWDFSSLGLVLSGARIDHLPNGKVMAYSLYKGPRGSILCINFRQLDYYPPQGDKELDGVRFYRHKDLWIGLVRYGSVFCLLVSRLTPAQMAPALTVGAPKTGVSTWFPSAPGPKARLGPSERWEYQ
jgi:hypothetical protein